MREIIEKGNIRRITWPGDKMLDAEYVNLYLGSGRFGGCFDAWGLMNLPYINGTRDGVERRANTVLMHADHYSRGHYGLDYHLPVARLVWHDTFPQKVDSYEQNLNLYDGRLTTRLTSAEPPFHMAFNASFNPWNRDIFSMEVEHSEGMPEILLALETDMIVQYYNHFKGSIECAGRDEKEGWWLGRLRIGTADTYVCLKVLSEEGRAYIKESDKGPVISFSGEKGHHLILIGVAGAHRKDELMDAIRAINNCRCYQKECEEAWHKRWGNSYIDIPDSTYQALWCRSVYYLLCTYSPDVDCPAPPNGWTGNLWGFHFPQDFSFIHPVLLKLGHLDIAKAKVEFYRSRLENIQRYTRRIYKSEGTMYPWEFPIGTDFELLTESIGDLNPEEIRRYEPDGSLWFAAPMWTQFEIHNAAYPAKMAYETSMYVKDDTWTREVAWPMVRESARFYASIVHQEDDGKWTVYVEPSFGQTETPGDVSEKNFLCALYSAKYSLKTAVELASKLNCESEETAFWKQILDDGLAFNRVYCKKYGVYHLYEMPPHEAENTMPTGVMQINPLSILPLQELGDEILKAYQLRYEMNPHIKNNHGSGWGFAAFWLAAAHIRDAEGMLFELSRIDPMHFADKDKIQIYESTSKPHGSYYTTHHGLYLQALNDALLSDFWGEMEIGPACPDHWKEVSFANFHLKDGRIVSGKRVHGNWSIWEEK